MPVNDTRGDQICQTRISPTAPFTLVSLDPSSDFFQRRFASNEATLFSLSSSSPQLSPTRHINVENL